MIWFIIPFFCVITFSFIKFSTYIKEIQSISQTILYKLHVRERILSFDADCSSFSLAESHHVTCKKLPTNNGLPMHNVLQLCFAANNILLMRKRNHAFIFLANYRSSVKMEHHFKLGDRMIKQLLNSIITKYRDLLVSRS